MTQDIVERRGHVQVTPTTLFLSVTEPSKHSPVLSRRRSLPCLPTESVSPECKVRHTDSFGNVQFIASACGSVQHGMTSTYEYVLSVGDVPGETCCLYGLS
jgi:hypothetical protein